MTITSALLILKEKFSTLGTRRSADHYWLVRFEKKIVFFSQEVTRRSDDRYWAGFVEKKV